MKANGLLILCAMNTIGFEQVENKIITLRNTPVILDSDVAELYGVETKRVNEAVSNNPDKFPAEYIIRLEKIEWDGLKSKLKYHIIVELKIDKFRHEYASQLNMYLNYFKAEVMQPDDNLPVGLLLCTEKGDTLVKVCHCRIRPEYLCAEVHDRAPNRRRNKRVHLFLKLLKTTHLIKSNTGEKGNRPLFFSSPAPIFCCQ